MTHPPRVRGAAAATCDIPPPGSPPGPGVVLGVVALGGADEGFVMSGPAEGEDGAFWVSGVVCTESLCL